MYRLNTSNVGFTPDLKQDLTDLKQDQGGFVKEIPRDRIYYLVDVCGIIYIVPGTIQYI